MLFEKTIDRMNKYPSVWFNYDNSLFGLKSDKNEI